jgi:hypothetical protein
MHGCYTYMLNSQLQSLKAQLAWLRNCSQRVDHCVNVIHQDAARLEYTTRGNKALASVFRSPSSVRYTPDLSCQTTVPSTGLPAELWAHRDVPLFVAYALYELVTSDVVHTPECGQPCKIGLAV